CLEIAVAPSAANQVQGEGALPDDSCRDRLVQLSAIGRYAPALTVGRIVRLHKSPAALRHRTIGADQDRALTNFAAMRDCGDDTGQTAPRQPPLLTASLAKIILILETPWPLMRWRSEDALFVSRNRSNGRGKRRGDGECDVSHRAVGVSSAL